MVENGWLHREISRYNNRYQRKIETAEMPIVGVNYSRAEEDRTRDIEVFEYPETYSRQKAKMKRLKKERNDTQVKACLKTLRKKCHTNENLFPYALEAVKNLCTLGEIEEIFRQEFGLWAFPLL